MSAAAVLDRWQEAFHGRVPGAPEPAWLEARRAEAFDRFRTLGFPTRRDEAWRSIDLAPIVRTAWTPAALPDEGTLGRARALLAALPEGPGGRLVVVNGHWVPALSDDTARQTGVRVATLADAADRLEQALGEGLTGEEHAFTALNAALFPDALLVDVPAGLETEAPLRIVALALGDDGTPRALHPRLLLRLGAGARLAVAATWAGEAPSPLFQNVVVETRLADGARLDWTDVQVLPDPARHVASFGVRVGRDAAFAGTCVQLGGSLVRMDIDAVLEGPGAFCRIDGVSLLGGKQHVDVRTNLDHAVPHGSSTQLFKSILDGHASAAYAGRVLVRPGAQKTDARQANHSLLLSKHAVADSVPQLEIFADDVKCAHGATVGQIDEDALFYLRSRGLDLEQARAMLVRAFASEVAERVEHPDLADHVHGVLLARLGGGEETA